MSENNKKELNNETDIEKAPETNLSPESFARFFKSLGEDALNDMLERAGLNSEVDSADTAASEQDRPGNADTISEDKPSKKRKTKKNRLVSSLLFAFIFIGILFVLVAANMIYMSVTVNTHDPIEYAEQTDTISADTGLLNVNNVSVSVPTSGKEDYRISYSWAEEDKDYPSVPHAITVVYPDPEGKDLYSISLYKNETIPPDKLPAGKNADNWFDSWQTDSESDVQQTRLDTDIVKGFYIYPREEEPDGTNSSDYGTFSYYFTVPDGKAVSIYVLEGQCLGENSSARVRDVMQKCIEKITIKEPDVKQS